MTAKRKPGRPTLLDERTITSLEEGIKRGHPIKTACMAAGIGQATYYTWMSKAESEPGSIYSQFRERLQKAEQEGKATLLDIIYKAAATQWQAAAWLSERRWPAEFGRRMEIEHGLSPVMLALRNESRMLTTPSVEVLEGETELENHEQITSGN